MGSLYSEVFHSPEFFKEASSSAGWMACVIVMVVVGQGKRGEAGFPTWYVS